MRQTCRACMKTEKDGVRDTQTLSVLRIVAGHDYKHLPRYHSTICVKCATKIVSYQNQLRNENRGLMYQSDGFLVDSVEYELKSFLAREAKEGLTNP